MQRDRSEQRGLGVCPAFFGIKDKRWLLIEREVCEKREREREELGKREYWENVDGRMKIRKSWSVRIRIKLFEGNVSGKRSRYRQI